MSKQVIISDVPVELEVGIDRLIDEIKKGNIQHACDVFVYDFNSLSKHEKFMTELILAIDSAHFYDLDSIQIMKKSAAEYKPMFRNDILEYYFCTLEASLESKFTLTTNDPNHKKATGRKKAIADHRPRPDFGAPLPRKAHEVDDRSSVVSTVVSSHTKSAYAPPPPPPKTSGSAPPPPPPQTPRRIFTTHDMLNIIVKEYRKRTLEELKGTLYFTEEDYNTAIKVLENGEAEVVNGKVIFTTAALFVVYQQDQSCKLYKDFFDYIKKFYSAGNLDEARFERVVKNGREDDAQKLICDTFRGVRNLLVDRTFETRRAFEYSEKATTLFKIINSVNEFLSLLEFM